MRSLLLALMMSTLLIQSVHANETVDRSRTLQGEARAANKQGDRERAELLLREAVALRPMHPGLKVELASTLVANNKPTEALVQLQNAAELGYAFRFGDSKAFAALQVHPLAAEITAHIERNRAPVGRGEAFAAGLPMGLIPEGIAWHAAGKTTFVASISQGRVYRAGSGTDTAATPFSSGELYGAFGMAIDQPRGALWLATTQLNEHAASREAKTLNGAAVARLSLASGKVETLYKLAADGAEHGVGDVALAPNGAVFATDSRAPVIYRADEKAGTLEKWLESKEFSSLQGMAIAANGKHAWVADYAVGIARIDMVTKKVQWLSTPAKAMLLGIDGLYRRGCDLIATQNGMAPNRVLRIVLSADGGAVRAVDVVAANLPGMDDLTLGTLVGDKTLRFIARSDWHSVKPDGTLPDKLDEPVVMDIALPPADCAKR